MRYHGRQVFIGRLCPGLFVRTCIRGNFWRRSLAFSSVRALRGLLLPARLSKVPVSRNFLNSLLTPCLVQLFSGNSSVNFCAVYSFKYKLFIKILSSSLNTMLIVDKHCCGKFLMPQIDCKSKWVKEQRHIFCNQYGERFAILNTENIKISGWITRLKTIKNAICLCFLPHLQKSWIFTARRSYASAVLGVVILSVCPSVCHTRALWLIQRTYRLRFEKVRDSLKTGTFWDIAYTCTSPGDGKTLYTTVQSLVDLRWATSVRYQSQHANAKPVEIFLSASNWPTDFSC